MLHALKVLKTVQMCDFSITNPIFWLLQMITKAFCSGWWVTGVNTKTQFLVSGSTVSINLLPHESMGAPQARSQTIELMLLWRSWEPEPWQPSAQISVGRELAWKIHARFPNRGQSSQPWQIQMFIYWLLIESRFSYCWVVYWFILNTGLYFSHDINFLYTAIPASTERIHNIWSAAQPDII